MYRVILTTKAGRVFKKLPKEVALLIVEAIEKLTLDPFSSFLDIKKLKYPLEGYRLRVRDWRILYTIENDIIDIQEIYNRKDAYK